MLLNCGVGEDSWESLGLQGDPTSPSYRRSVLGVHWKDWCWSWNSNTVDTWYEELTHLKRPNAGKDWGQEEKGTTEDEMVGWHHRLNGHEFGWTLGVADRQGGLACCNPWGHKDLDKTEWLNWTELYHCLWPFSLKIHFLFPLKFVTGINSLVVSWECRLLLDTMSACYTELTLYINRLGI